MIETLECMNVLIGICSAIRGLRNKLFNSDRKKQIGVWLEELSFIVEEVAECLSRKEFPHKTCARLGYLSEMFPITVGDALTEREEIHVHSLLISAVNIERTYGEYLELNKEDKVSYVQELYSIAGCLLGIADTLKYQD